MSSSPKKGRPRGEYAYYFGDDDEDIDPYYLDGTDIPNFGGD